MRLLLTSGLALAGLAFNQSSAHAAFTITAVAGGSAESGATYSTFDGRALGGAPSTGTNGLSLTFAGTGGIVNGSATGQYAAPVLSGSNNLFFEPTTPAGADTTNYVSTGTGSTTLTFASGPQVYLGLLWGSVDAYNTLTFLGANGGTVASFTGSQILALAGTNPTGTLYVNFNTTIAFTSVVATSTQNSFEFDNVANAAVPEPSSMALCGVAGMIGAIVTRKRARRVIA